ncbi:MAG: hypothetical protein AAF748_15235 [Pseudomonadota bacterium]
MTVRLMILSAALTIASVVSAPAQDNNLWAAIGDWDISVDPTIDNGCYALATWNGGTVLRIGRNPQADNFYFLIGNDKWTSLQPNGSYEIKIQFGNRPTWDVSANGFQFNPGETVYLQAQSTQIDFIREFQAALNMRITYNGNEIDNLKLTGSRRAWDEVERCQTAQFNRPSTGGGNGDDDPFANDPFGNGNSGGGATGGGQTKNSSSKNR